MRTGRFSEEENQRIKQNMADFLALTGISSIEKVVFPERHKEEHRQINKLKIQHCYVEKIGRYTFTFIIIVETEQRAVILCLFPDICSSFSPAEGVPRACDHVNLRTKLLFDEYNNKGKYVV